MLPACRVCAQMKRRGVDVFSTYPVIDALIVGTSRQAAIDEVIERAKRSHGGYACFVNSHVAVMTRQREDVRKALLDATFAFPDGMPVYLTGKYLYGMNSEKISGPDFLTRIFSCPESRKLGHYFYGSTPDVLSKLVDTLQRKYTGCNIVGVCSPPFRELDEREKQEHLDAIQAAGAQIVWVGLGAPKQELWMQASTASLPGVMLLGVGAAFDFHAGMIERAPDWAQRWGLEWLHRLIQEPRRLARRYLETNSLFLWYTAKEQLARIFSRAT